MFSTNDTINGLFELIGGLAGWANVFKLMKDKAVRGLYWPLTIFFTVWGAWNVYYYPCLHQPLSTIGGIFMLTSNIAWVILAYKYRNAIIVEDTFH